MVAYVHIEYSTYQFSEESKGGWLESNPLSPGPCRTEKSVVLRGLNNIVFSVWLCIKRNKNIHSFILKWDFFHLQLKNMTKNVTGKVLITP